VSWSEIMTRWMGTGLHAITRHSAPQDTSRKRERSPLVSQTVHNRSFTTRQKTPVHITASECNLKERSVELYGEKKMKIFSLFSSEYQLHEHKSHIISRAPEEPCIHGRKPRDPMPS